MELLKRLVKEEEGQGLVEYTLIVLLVALVFWFGIREAGVKEQLETSWAAVVTCLGAPTTCAGM